MDHHDQDAMTLVADAVVIDLRANAIRIRVPGYAGGAGEGQAAMLDVGSNGRLIGLELDDRYITVMDVPGADDPYVRTAAVLVDVSAADPPAITLPRRGADYEITYPSGNECWQTKSVDGRLIQVCATLDAAPRVPSASPAPQTKALPRRR